MSYALMTRADLVVEIDRLLKESAKDDWAQISPSIYETARVVSVAPWLDGHSARLRYLCDEQLADGSWGLRGFRLVPTLSATEALLAAGSHHPSTDLSVSRKRLAHAARRGLETIYRWLGPGTPPAPLPDTVAIEFIVPRLVSLINDHLDRHFQSPVLDLPGWLRTTKLHPPANTEPRMLERLR
jgi:hypothetical protein